MEKTQGNTHNQEKQGGMSNQKPHEGTMKPGMHDPNEKNPKPNTGMGHDDKKMGQGDQKKAERPTMHDSADNNRNSDGTYQKSDDKRVTDQKRDDKRAADDMNDEDDDSKWRSNSNKEEHKTEGADTKRSGSM